jgi:hypothetical protein
MQDEVQEPIVEVAKRFFRCCRGRVGSCKREKPLPSKILDPENL